MYMYMYVLYSRFFSSVSNFRTSANSNPCKLILLFKAHIKICRFTKIKSANISKSKILSNKNFQLYGTCIWLWYMYNYPFVV